MTIDLTDSIILVTGASRGIGREIATQLARAGATVALHTNRNEAAAAELATQLSHGAKAFRADLESFVSCERLFDDVVAHYGRVDVLVNNAGISESAPLELSAAEWVDAWDRTLAVNLRAPAQLCRRAIRFFTTPSQGGSRQEGSSQGGPGRGGRIINIASRSAFRGDEPDALAYAASKGGLVALTRSIARKFGKMGITAFTIAPGWVRTEMAADYIASHGEEGILQDLALDRLTEPRDIAPFVVLAASGLVDHATGSTIDVNAASYVH